MYVATAIFTIFALASAQEVGFTDGDSVVAGPNAISNPNVNNGWQADSSLFANTGAAGGAAGGPQVFNDVVGSSFTHVNSNTAIKDNLVNNPSASFVSGNDGWTANGDRNQLGPVQNDFGAFHKRGNVVFANNHHQVGSQVTHAASPQPVFFAYAKRAGDVVFGETHHQVNTQAVRPAVVPVHHARPLPLGPAFVKRNSVTITNNHPAHVVPGVVPYPGFVGIQHVVPAVGFHAPVQPLRAEANEQKATIVQNHA
ncbi:hypothetical protein EV183_005452 [Coemansia sp. RSA 2336]|nr:hypothetical protein EV183_005452 [Coemansia sp. RSA 2336]